MNKTSENFFHNAFDRKQSQTMDRSFGSQTKKQSREKMNQRLKKKREIKK